MLGFMGREEPTERLCHRCRRRIDYETAFYAGDGRLVCAKCSEIAPTISNPIVHTPFMHTFLPCCALATTLASLIPGNLDAAIRLAVIGVLMALVAGGVLVTPSGRQATGGGLDWRVALAIAATLIGGTQSAITLMRIMERPPGLN
jgi:hypothetical protein